MYSRLPNDLIVHIYSFDLTYRYLYNKCIQELVYMWKQKYIQHVLYRSHCC